MTQLPQRKTKVPVCIPEKPGRVALRGLPRCVGWVPGAVSHRIRIAASRWVGGSLKRFVGVDASLRIECSRRSRLSSRLAAILAARRSCGITSRLAWLQTKRHDFVLPLAAFLAAAHGQACGDLQDSQGSARAGPCRCCDVGQNQAFSFSFQ